LDKLGNGEKLTGSGIAELSADSGSEAPVEVKVEEGFKEMDTSATGAEIQKFKDACEIMLVDEAIREKAKAMARSFCVVVLQSSYHPGSGKTFSKYENFRVLVGPQDNISALQAAFEANLSGFTFEVNNQIRPM